MRLFPLIVLIFLSLPAAAQQSPAAREEAAEALYRNYGSAVYQVQTVDVASNRKNAIGSGFQLSAEGFLATNYHVVAEAVQRPRENRIEYLSDSGVRGRAEILAVDAVNDLALLKMEQPGKTFVTLGSPDLPKGAKIWALGNPHDIGFTIIEGTYSGLAPEGFREKIHFSGSLNPGMSGGPAIDRHGRVIGINVSTAGDQISFLVPVSRLADLYAAGRQGGEDFLARMESQLVAHQGRAVETLLSKEWETAPFGPLSVPGRIDPAFRCWGGAEHKEKDPFTYRRSTCISEETIFLDEGFYTGSILYAYDLIEGGAEMILPRFYNFYEGQFGNPLETSDPRDSLREEENVTNFACRTRFLDAGGARWKAAFCARRYKKYPRLHDVHVYMALVGRGKTGALVTLAAHGLTEENALKMARAFISRITVPEAAP